MRVWLVKVIRESEGEGAGRGSSAHAVSIQHSVRATTIARYLLTTETTLLRKRGSAPKMFRVLSV
jgi:hypothetical protein